MLNKLTEINSISAIQQGLNQNLYGLHEIQFEDKSLGSGAVGSILKVINIDGVTYDGLVLKIITDPEFIDKSLETITLLHDKVNKHQLKTGVPVFIEVPELTGLPFLAFKAKFENSDQQVAAYLMHDLFYNGYSDFGSEGWDRQKYNTEIGFEERLYMCYQLARGVNFLHEQQFIHADLKDYSIFINLERPQLSIIDFDGGYHYDKQPFALVIGAINAWASPWFRKMIGQGKSAKDVSTKDRLTEENWVLASGLFEILFGVAPFFFLKSIEGNSIENYLSKNRWPQIDQKDEGLNPLNINSHRAILQMIEGLSGEGLKPIIDAFMSVFNEGHSIENKRLTAAQWKDLLFAVCKDHVSVPQITEFSSDKTIINAKDELVKFAWKANFYRAVYLNNQLLDPLLNHYSLAIPDTQEVVIRCVNDFGEVEKKILITANRVDPVIKSFNANIIFRVDPTPVTLEWLTEHCKSVSITPIGEGLKPSGSLDVNPHEKTLYTLTGHGFFDQKVTASLEVGVQGVQIKSFRYEINIEKGIDNIDLYWETEHATEVEILPKIGKVDPAGSSSIGIIEKSNFTLRAKGYFNEVESVLEAQPFPIPLIKGIFVPTPVVKMEAVVPHELLKIPDTVLEPIKIAFNNNIYFSEAKPPFVTLEEKKKLDNKIGGHARVSNVLTLFNNLFNRIDKKHESHN